MKDVNFVVVHCLPKNNWPITKSAYTVVYLSMKRLDIVANQEGTTEIKIPAAVSIKLVVTRLE